MESFIAASMQLVTLHQIANARRIEHGPDNIRYLQSRLGQSQPAAVTRHQTALFKSRELRQIIDNVRAEAFAVRGEIQPRDLQQGLYDETSALFRSVQREAVVGEIERLVRF